MPRTHGCANCSGLDSRRRRVARARHGNRRCSRTRQSWLRSTAFRRRRRNSPCISSCSRDRADVFALRWQNDTSGRSGWSPAVRGGWSKVSRARRDYLPLTDEVLAAHLAGRSTIGLYPAPTWRHVHLLVCDFDGRTWALDALAYLDACHRRGRAGCAGTVPLGRRRACVDLLQCGPSPRRRHGRWGRPAARGYDCTRQSWTLASYDRFFPSQDFMPKGSFGNLIALPLHGDRATTGQPLSWIQRRWSRGPTSGRSFIGRPPDAGCRRALGGRSLRPVDAGPS